MLSNTLQKIALTTALSIGLSFSIAQAKENNAEKTAQNRVPLEDVQRFSTAISQIKRYYVKPTTDKKLFDNAIQGMLTGLDPHSSYLDEDAFKELQSSTSGEFGGLGIEVTMEEGVVKVITPIDDTPAFKAGIKPGDYIIKLDNKAVQGLTLKEAVKLMRGKKGSTIDLTVFRKGEKEPLKFTIIREVIQVKSVKSKLLDNEYGYIRVSHFQALTAKDVLNAVKQLNQKAGGNIKGLVLDLRNNPGGLLDSAIQVSDHFIHNDKAGQEELIVYTQGRLPGSKFTAIANPGDILKNAPIVVLINGGSASGSEIVAGALKDNKRALLLGTKSFGKGSVQTVLPLDGKRGIKLTTALYYTPKGTSIQAKGITPDIIIENIKIPEKKKSKVKLISEADLNRHLSNANTKKQAEKKQKAANKKLLHNDYQLHTALTILKGMSIAKK
jgi:carboxyl-terminal processing protease